MNTAYNYTGVKDIATALDANDAIQITVHNYMHHQLGWSLEKCKARVKVEVERQIPIGILNSLQNSGWNIKGAKLLDVGAGQGGAVLEAMLRSADAYGIEPGDEFRTLAQMRLKEAGQDPARILSAPGEQLPFSDDTFDYVISLQVLEHVSNPEPVMKEIYRVLKPGGQCYVTCENYLSFWEQHYRIPWLPMLPKSIGAIYLRLIKRNPDFLEKYVFYSTYPQIWNIAEKLGYQNITLEERLKRVLDTLVAKSKLEGLMAVCARIIPAGTRPAFITKLIHLTSFWRVGVKVRLMKPARG